MTLSGHLAECLDCLSEDDCLLVNDDGCFVKCEKHPDRQGVYLYFDMICEVFVRSGKVAGRGFTKRDDEHLEEAKKNTPSSKFYRRWPSKHSERAGKRGIKGHFEQLIQLIAVGFDPDSEQSQYLDKNWDEGGVLILTEQHKKLIRASMKNLNCPAKIKFHHMLAYQMELGYDLAVAPDWNASGNPGFESVIGVFSSCG